MNGQNKKSFRNGHEYIEIIFLLIKKTRNTASLFLYINLLNLLSDLERNISIDCWLILVGNRCSDLISPWVCIDMSRGSTFLSCIARQCFSISEIPTDLCRQTVEFYGERNPISDFRHLRRIIRNADIQGLISSFDDDIGIRRNGDFTSFFGLDRYDRMEFSDIS